MVRCALAASLVLALSACTSGSTRSSLPPSDSAAATEQPPLSLDADAIMKDLATLADDGWAGRFTKDLEHLGPAADYIAASHEKAGLSPIGNSYRVDFEYVSGKEPGDAFFIWVERAGGTTQLPESAARRVSFAKARAVVATAAWIADGQTDGVRDRLVLTPSPSGDVKARLQALSDAGARAVLFIGEAPLPTVDIDLASAVVSQAVATAELGLPSGPAPKAAQVLEGLQLSLARAEKEVKSIAPNVLGWIEGTEHPEEIVLLGAHYDHIGTKAFGTFCRGPEEDSDPDDVICNGADDNASGSALLMNIARAFGESGYAPKRTVVFAHFAGEELGLLGSKALAELPPAGAPFEGARVVAMLNMDMVGRLGEDGLEVGGEKTSPAWPELLAASAPDALTITHPASVTGRSDHAHWMRQGIPVLFFFTGLHADYHRTSDEVDTINVQGIADIGTLVLGVAKALADGADIPPVPDAK
ncbi:MAG: M20/M25/M40 family metallo-hydrolase [Myxococcota bacterium]